MSAGGCSRALLSAALAVAPSCTSIPPAPVNERYASFDGDEGDRRTFERVRCDFAFRSDWREGDFSARITELLVLARRHPNCVPALALLQDLRRASGASMEQYGLDGLDLTRLAAPVRIYLRARVCRIAAEALELVKRCLAEDPKMYWARALRARLKLEENPPRLHGAERDLRNARADAPGNLFLWRFLAQTYEHERLVDLAEAFEHYGWILACVPNDLVSHYGIARVLISLGRSEEAIAHLLRVVRSCPASAAARHALGLAYIDSGKLKRAAEVYLGMKKDFPGDVHVDFSLGVVYQEMGQREKAIQSYQAFIDRLDRRGLSSPNRLAAQTYLQELRRRNEQEGR